MRIVNIGLREQNMEASELKEILDQHQLWIDGKGGSRANLCGSNLRDADLGGANLGGANLGGASLTDADLGGANLTRASLTDADLRGAILTGAILTGAILTGADLGGADLEYANLTNTILPDISWIIPGCLAQLNKIKYAFYLAKDGKRENFIQDSLGFIIQDNVEEKTFDMLVGDSIIRNIPDWVKYSGMKQIPKHNEG